MRYIDTGDRDPTKALGHWLQGVLTPDVRELRWQTGFFGADGLAVFLPTLLRLSADDLPVRVIIGSNDGETLQDHVAALVTHLGLPRTNARLGVASYGGAFYHPKTYHFRRNDSSQAAYVGSANLTLAGVSSLHIEAGVTLDTREGDPPALLSEISSAVDSWFDPQRPGLEIIRNLGDVESLVGTGVLSLAALPRAPSQASANSTGNLSVRPRLQPLVRFPIVPAARPAVVLPAPAQAGIAALTAVPQGSYPPYVLFAPGSASPTVGPAALTGAALPGGVQGLIIRLNRDSARHWQGGEGTANISVPVPTVSTLRFGIYKRRYERPRAEFPIEIRLVGDAQEFRASSAETNVMVYGFAKGETGHGDVRLLVPKPPIQEISSELRRAGLQSPAAGDAAILEWPSASAARFRLTFLNRGSAIFERAAGILANAATTNQLVGQGACWLPAGLSPAW